MKTTWQTKKLSEVCDIGAGNSAPQKKEYFIDGIYPFFRTADVGRVKISKSLNQVSDYLNDEGIKKLKLFKKGTILLPKSGASTFLNHRVVMGVDGYVVSHLATIKTDEKILNNNFLFYFLQEIKAQDLIQDHKYPSLNLSVIGQIKIPLPSLSEQLRIVKILDEVFENIKNAKENTEKNLQNAKDLFESYLQSVFANPGNDWEEKRLGEVCDFVRGPFGGSLKKSIFKKEGYVVYEQQHAIYNQFTKVRYFIDEKKFNEMKRFELKSGDLIMSCSGTMGKIAIAPDDIKRGIINQALLKLSPSKNLLNVFLKNWMESGVFQDDLKTYTKGAAIKNVVSVKILKGIKILVPKIQEQKTIVANLSALSGETKKLEAIYKQKLADLEELKKSVLKKVFNGDLQQSV